MSIPLGAVCSVKDARRAAENEARTLMRKTSLLQDRSDDERSGSIDMGCAPVTLITCSKAEAFGQK
jgi:hypothetical protein